MSGGSYSYIYSQLLDQCKGMMFDSEMNDLIVDLAEVLHDLEWWQSCDSSEEEYRNTVSRFKEKWLHPNEGLNALQEIKQIIDAPIYLQEDVWRYKAICEVVKGVTQNENSN